MGFVIEICDTLKLKRGKNFPAEEIKVDKEYSFTIEDVRLYNMYPSRVFLVEEIDGMWNYIGHAQITNQTIDALKKETSGIFKIVQIYENTYTAELNNHESPAGKGFKAKQ